MNEVAKLPGISTLEVSHKNGNAIITFDHLQTNIDSITTAINSTGYEVKSKKEIQ